MRSSPPRREKKGGTGGVGSFPSSYEEGCPRERAGWSDFSENQVPDAVAEVETAAFELGLRPGVRPLGIAGSGIFKRSIGGEHLQHLLGVFLPIGAGVHGRAGLHF